APWVRDEGGPGRGGPPHGTRLYVSGAGNSTVHELRWETRTVTPRPEEGEEVRPFLTKMLVRGDDLVLGRPMPVPREGANRPDPVPQSFIGALAVTPDGSRLFAVHVLGQLLSAVDLRTGHVLRSITLEGDPYGGNRSADGRTLFVALWGGAKVRTSDASSLEPKGEIAVGEHPNAMAVSRDGRRLFVACANTNAVWIADVVTRQAAEQVNVS